MMSGAGDFLFPFLVLLVATLSFIVFVPLLSRIFHALSQPPKGKRNQTEKRDKLLLLLFLIELLRSDASERSPELGAAHVDEHGAKDRKGKVIV